jgi:23S rRNA pseudouridine2605 synthase
MFEEVGHFVEKIRRVGFGPLVLDIEPGEVRELTADEIVQLKKAGRRPMAKRNGAQTESASRRPKDKGPAALPRVRRVKTAGRRRHR